MTPQIVPSQTAGHFDSVEEEKLVGAHLTPEQFGELLAAADSDASPNAALAEAHLLTCTRCSAELDELRQSIILFRNAVNAYADEQLQRRSRWTLPARLAPTRRFVPAYWAAAAAAMLLTALLPMQVLRHSARPAQPAAVASSAPANAQSDEALLDDVDRAISTSVPTPMQALADPTADASNSNSTSTSSQRK